MCIDNLKGVSSYCGKYNLRHSGKIKVLITYTDDTTEMFETEISNAKPIFTDKTIKSIIQI